MSYYALYLKYRPLRFEEVVGQDPIVKTLQNALKNDKLAHAYLFSGPRGTGKTSMARLLAKAINCHEGFGKECNRCDNCIDIIDGVHPDVIEIDAASNNGVDDIRSLIDSVRYAPIKGDYKVYIIDEVHMMTPNAFNALLKTLEEPPPHVIFILATTEIHKVPQTIASRCQRFDFQRVSDKSIKKRLRIVLDKESIEYDNESIDLITSLADGGMRDALSILDQVVNYTNNVINVVSIRELYSLVNQSEKIELLKNIFLGNTGIVLEKLNYLIDKGAKIQSFTEDLNEILKDLVIYKTLKDPSYLHHIDSEEAKELSNLVSETNLLEMMSILTLSEAEYRNIHNIRNLFEITILRLMNVNRTKQVTKEIIVLKEETPPVISEEKIPEPKISEPIVSPKPTPKVEKPPEKVNALYRDVYQRALSENHPAERVIKISEENLIKVLAHGDKKLKMSIGERWPELKKYYDDEEYGDFAELLFDAVLNVAANDILIVEFDYDYIINKFNDERNIPIVQELLRTVFGVPYVLYGLNRIESANLIKLWRDLSQIGKLPRGKEIEYNIKEIIKNAK